MDGTTVKFLMLCFVGLAILTSLSNAAKSKYSKEGNRDAKQEDFGDDFESSLNSESKLKTKKAKMIWKKAYKKYRGDTVTLDTLYDELRAIDKELMDLKLLKSENGDPYGVAENQLGETIHEILIKYGIAGKTPEFEEKPSNRVQDYAKEKDKFERMYNKAQELGFSEKELRDLKEEIFHHKLKMAELDALVGDLQVAEEQLRVSSNVVDKKLAKDSHDDVPHKVKKIKDAIKEKRQEVVNSKNRLNLLSDSPNMARDKTFTQHKIIHLWADILKSNFTAEERESLKEELMHLENKMNKMDRLNEEKSLLEKHQQSITSGAGSLKEKYEQKHQQAKEKSDQLEKHVKKYVRDINSRISERRQHTEL